jgi:hypothetical protein
MYTYLILLFVFVSGVLSARRFAVGKVGWLEIGVFVVAIAGSVLAIDGTHANELSFRDELAIYILPLVAWATLVLAMRREDIDWLVHKLNNMR